MLKIGIVGAGHLGRIHLRLAEASELYELVGFYDTNAFDAKSISLASIGLVSLESL